MQTGCRISTRDKTGLTILAQTGSLNVPATLRLPTDSKSLSSFVKLYVRWRQPPTPPFFEIGRESAFTEVPTIIKALQTKSARRKS